MVSAQLLHLFLERMRDATREPNTYKIRFSDGTVRLGGGYNFLFFGDWWQIAPVTGTPLFHVPSPSIPRYLENTVSIFWRRGADSIQRLWELRQQMRLTDAWYIHFVTQCRNGELGAEDYNFIHGFPTRHAGSWCSADATLACANDECRSLQEDTWPALRAQGQAWEAMQRLECSVCAQHRAERARLLKEKDPRAQTQEFVNAMYVHPNNEPKYYAIQTRAIEFAKREQEAILWVEAKDKPYNFSEPGLSREAREARKVRWLQKHDMETKGIMGLFPLIPNLPVRLTETIDRKLRLHKHRQAYVRRWCLHPGETSTLRDGVRELRKMPTCIILSVSYTHLTLPTKA